MQFYLDANSYLKQSSVRAVEKHLGKSEVIEGVIFAYTPQMPYIGFNGAVPGGLWVTNQRLLYVGFNGMIFKKPIMIDHVYSAISAVEMEIPKVSFNFIQIYSAGVWHRYVNIWKEARIEEYVGLIRSKISQIHDSLTAQTNSQPPTSDLATQLERLDHLRTKGALTDKEYDDAKRKLLS